MGPSPFLSELSRSAGQELEAQNSKEMVRLLAHFSLVCSANFQKLKNKLNGLLSQEGKTRHSQIKANPKCNSESYLVSGTQIKTFWAPKTLDSPSPSAPIPAAHSLFILVGSDLFHSMLAAILRDGHPVIFQPLPSPVSQGLWHFPWCQAPASLHDSPPLSPGVSSRLRMYQASPGLFCWDLDPVTQYQASDVVHYPL